MNTIRKLETTQRRVWSLGVGCAMAATLLLAVGVDARDQRGSQFEGLVSSTPAARTVNEHVWNEREDARAGSYVGLPASY